MLQEYEAALPETISKGEDAISAEAKAALSGRHDLDLSGVRALKLGRDVQINKDVQIIIPVDSSMSKTRTQVWLGDKTYLGRRVELQVGGGDILRIGDHTTVNHNCVMQGSVEIGRYCLLSCNIFISSGNHQTTLFPTWTMRDQDTWYQLNLRPDEVSDSVVHIEEDCWIGYGVFIKRGIYIGRGAVIGSYSIVTHDVPPYSIQVGAPNRELSKRLHFCPPAELDAANEEHRPYFYAGFLVQQKDIQDASKEGIIYAKSACRIVLRGGPFEDVRLCGRLRNPTKALKLSVHCNGILLGHITATDHDFSGSLAADPAAWSSAPRRGKSQVMQDYNQIHIQVVSDSPDVSEDFGLDRDVWYGISSVHLKREYKDYEYASTI